MNKVSPQMTFLPLAQKCHGRSSAELAGQGHHILGKRPDYTSSMINRALGQHQSCHRAHVELPISMVRAWKNTLCAYHGASRQRRAQGGNMVSYKELMFYNLECFTLVN